MMVVVGNDEGRIEVDVQVPSVLLSDLENIEETADDDFHIGCGMF